MAAFGLGAGKRGSEVAAAQLGTFALLSCFTTSARPCGSTRALRAPLGRAILISDGINVASDGDGRGTSSRTDLPFHKPCR